MSGIFVVYGVESGDRLTLITQSAPLVTKQVMLTGIMAPRMSRMKEDGTMSEDPYAFEARELIRKKCIGKQVRFEMDGKNDAAGREVGRVSLQGGEDMGLALVQLGYASVVEQAGLGPQDYMISMIQADEIAKNAHIGKHSRDAAMHVRKVRPSPPADPQGLLDSMKAEGPQKVLIERVLSGSSMIVTVQNYNQQLSLSLAGIQSPSLKTTPAEYLAVEAKGHTERCLNHRELTVEFEAVSASGIFIGSIVAGKNVFQVDLLTRGFAKIMPTSVSNCPHRDRLRAAEKEAQEKKVGVWKDYIEVVAPEIKDDKPKYTGEKEFNGIVVQIVSGDTVVVARGDDNIKLTLASVRANKIMSRDGDRVKYDNYSWECKEELRKACIGKEVMVSIDYSRVIEETKELRPYATIVLAQSGDNLGAMLVSRGLARAVFFREETAVCADLLRDAQASAEQRKVGLHSPKEPTPVRVLELNRPNEKKARQYLGYFQRGGQSGRAPRLAATVEMVLSAGSIRVYIGKENIVITLKLAGITAPSGAMGEQAADPFADESKKFAMLTLQNRDVEVEVDTVDKFGNFLGAIYVNNVNFAITIVKAGLAVVSNVDKLSYGSELRAAEKKAQDQNLKIWSDAAALPARFKAAQERANRALPGVMVAAREAKFSPIMITEVIDSTLFFVCSLDDDTKVKRKAVERALDEYTDDRLRYHPKKDELCIVRFSQDGRWYRGRAMGLSADKKLTKVRFVDFGNSEERCDDDIRECTVPVLRDTPPLTTEAGMAFLRKLPSEFSESASDELRNYLDVPALYGRVEYTMGSRKFYTIASSAEGGESAAATMMKKGFAVVDPAVEKLDNSLIQADVKQLSQLQSVACKSGKNVWKYGTTVMDSDDDE